MLVVECLFFYIKTGALRETGEVLTIQFKSNPNFTTIMWCFKQIFIQVAIIGAVNFLTTSIATATEMNWISYDDDGTVAYYIFSIVLIFLYMQAHGLFEIFFWCMLIWMLIQDKMVRSCWNVD